MAVRCPKCNEGLELEVRPRFGQHIVCPYCDEKFTYDVRPTRISLPSAGISNSRTMPHGRRDPSAPGVGNVTIRPAARVPTDAVSMSSQATVLASDCASAQNTGRLRTGTMLLGRYEVLAELGQGGMGIVYRCYDKIGGVEVAVKGLPPEVSHDSASMEDIRDNFQLVSDLRHPGIVGIRNLESDPATGDYYLVMDVAPGRSLRRWAKTHQGPEHAAAKLSIIGDIAVALDYAHIRSVMHRDIKPENIMIDDGGHAHILDFGLASQIRSSMSRVSLVTRSQSGTPFYKAPEQWRGQPQNAATDLYSLGVLAYELLAGYLPFDSEDMSILRMSVLSEPPARIAGVPDSVNAALLRALAKTPSERFSSCGDFVKALKGLTASESAPPVNSLPPKTPAGADYAGESVATVRKVGVIGAIVAVVAVVYIAVFVMTGDTTVRDKTADTPRGDPVELALEAFRKDDYQHGYQYAMSTDKTHPKLQCYIGMCYDQQEPRSRGMLITKDDWTARTWYEKSAAQGDARAMTYLGVFCENGRGGDVDCAKAIDWYSKASQKNYPEGKANLDRLAKKLKKAKKDEEEERTRMQKKKEEDERKKKENDAHLEKQRQRGYTIEGYGGERRAVWHAGTTLAQYPHWITTAKENTWRIEDGYEKVDPSAPALSPVAWKPGIFKSPDVKSGEKEGTWLHKIICPTCSGSKSIAYYADCDMCGGRGRVSTSRDCARCNGRGLVQMQSTCASCNGSGRSVGQCVTCRGSGRRMCSNCGGRGQIVNPVAVGVGIANIFGAAKGRGGIPTGPSTITCMSCGGRGYMACSGCGGAGTVTSNCRACSGRGRTLSNTTCQFCGGSGKTALSGDCPNCTNGKVKKSRQCQSCKGKGAIWK